MDTTNLPKTRKEAQVTGVKYYFTGEPCKHGHVAPRKTKGACIECLKVEWQQGNEKRTEYFKQYNQSDAGKDAKQAYYARNKEAVKARADARTPEEKKRWKLKHKQSNPDYYKTLTSLRKRRHRNATPKWVTAEQKLAIRKLYLQAMELTRLTGERYVVDHIVPLISDEVCGLHVPWNLRVITQEENLRKSNKLLDTPHST
jgi:hypothetical protein